MPYLHLDLPGTYPIEVKRELVMRLAVRGVDGKRKYERRLRRLIPKY
jgi:hypothetical protein